MRLASIRAIAVAVFTAAVLGFSVQSEAHVITQGFVNSGPGSVTFWYGSYHDPSEFPAFGTEGSFQLVGVNGNPFPATIVPFTLHTGTQPAGLIDGVNNFLDPSYGAGPTAFDDVRRWQGATFVGLQPGDYLATYIPIGNPTVTWSPWSNAIRSFTVTLRANAS
jgi:hypothetical protein